MDSAKVLADKGIQGASVLLVTADLAARERLTRELRAVGAEVAERRHGPPPAVDIVLVDAATAEQTSKQLDMIRGDIRMRWSSVVRFPFLRAVPVGQPADLSELLRSLQPAVAPDRSLRERVSKEDLVRVLLAPMGAIRILRAVTLSGRTMHLTFDGGAVRGEVSVADGLVVCAFSETPDRSLEGGIALAPLLDLDAAQVTIARRDHPAAVNIMEPVDQALELAAVERPSLMQPLPANDVGQRITSPAPRQPSDRPTIGVASESFAMSSKQDLDDRPTAPPAMPRYLVGGSHKRFSQTISGAHNPLPNLAPAEESPTRRARTDSTAQFARAMAARPSNPAAEGSAAASQSVVHSQNAAFGATMPSRQRSPSSSQGLPPVDPRLSLPPRAPMHSGPPPKRQVAPPADREAAVAKTLLGRQPMTPHHAGAEHARKPAPSVAMAAPRGPELSDFDTDAQVEAALDAVLPRLFEDEPGLDDEPPTKVRNTSGLPESPAVGAQTTAPESSIFAHLDLDDMEEASEPPAAPVYAAPAPPSPPANAGPPAGPPLEAPSARIIQVAPAAPVPEGGAAGISMQPTQRPKAAALMAHKELYGVLGATVLAAALGVLWWQQGVPLERPRSAEEVSAVVEAPEAAAPAVKPAAQGAAPAAVQPGTEGEGAARAQPTAQARPEGTGEQAPPTTRARPAAPEARAPGSSAPSKDTAKAATSDRELAAEAKEEEEDAANATAEDGRDKEGSDRVCAEAIRVERSGDLDAAMALYEQGRELDPRGPRAYEGIARVSLKQGKTGDAVKAAERAVALRSRRVRYRVLLGDALAADGQVEAAKDSWRKALELDPEDANAQQRLYR